jgi:hypothetical protein
LDDGQSTADETWNDVIVRSISFSPIIAFAHTATHYFVVSEECGLDFVAVVLRKPRRE